MSDAVQHVAPDDHLDIYVPGATKCLKCGFEAMSATMFVGSGEIGLTKAQALVEHVGEPCPNDGTPMVKVLWRDRATEAIAAHSALINELCEVSGLPHLPAVIDRLKELEATRPPSQDALDRVRVRIQSLVSRGAEICPEYVHDVGGMPSCDRCGYLPDVHLLRDVLEEATRPQSPPTGTGACRSGSASVVQTVWW
jgi:hypothetical protein